jgi:hypothetical protein
MVNRVSPPTPQATVTLLSPNQPSEQSGPPRAPRLRSLKQAVTWLAAAALLWYVFYKVPFDQAWAALRESSPLAVIGLTLGYFVYAFLADVVATTATFRWFCAPLGLREVALMRGATYLLSILNYNLGQAGIIYLVSKKKRAGAANATGTVLLTMGMMFATLLVLSAIGSALSDASNPRIAAMRWVSSVGLAAFVLYLGVIALRPKFLARVPVLSTLLQAGVGGHLKAGLVRLPHVLGHVLFQWAILRMFHIDIPLASAATLLPIIFVIAWIPITVQGLGTHQLAAMELLSPFAVGASLQAQHARVVAFSLTLTTAFMVYSLVTGLLCLKGTAAPARAALPERDAPPSPQPEQPASPAPSPAPCCQPGAAPP